MSQDNVKNLRSPFCPLPFHDPLCQWLYLCNAATVLGLYGTLHQLRRMAIYDEFCEKDGAACMFATDIAARGLDFPAVDWVIQ